MKTDTRSRILERIRRAGSLRPSEIQKEFGISAQSIHRHLKKLLEESLIEARGSSPYTSYVAAGVPDLKGAMTWLNTKNLRENPQNVSETRDVFAARLPRMKELLSQGLDLSDLPLVVAVSGELGNNCFDHNLGQWRDVPGTWFEFGVTGKILWICVADRGQGIFSSLSYAHPHLQGEQEALEAAFETVISGRAPEKRGNGLKFVRQSVVENKERGLACLTGEASVFYGDLGEQSLFFLKQQAKRVEGTATLILWRLT